MKNVSIQIPYTLMEIDAAGRGLDSLYDWLSNSPNGESNDLLALSLSIDILTKIYKQIESEEFNGF